MALLLLQHLPQLYLFCYDFLQIYSLQYMQIQNTVLWILDHNQYGKTLWRHYYMSSHTVVIHVIQKIVSTWDTEEILTLCAVIHIIEIPFIEHLYDLFWTIRTKTFEVFSYLFDVHSNPMCTTIHTVIKINNLVSYPMSIPCLISEKHTHKLLYAHSLYLVNYIIIRQCFICKIAPSGEFLPKSSPFLLVIFFVFLLLEPATYCTCVIRPTTNEWWWCLRIHFSPIRPTTYEWGWSIWHQWLIVCWNLHATTMWFWWWMRWRQLIS